jgi:hypothetical protein
VLRCGDGLEKNLSVCYSLLGKLTMLFAHWPLNSRGCQTASGFPFVRTYHPSSQATFKIRAFDALNLSGVVLGWGEGVVLAEFWDRICIE